MMLQDWQSRWQGRFSSTAAGRWYAARESSEQRVVLALVVLIGITVLWLAVWKPISDWRSVAGNRYQNAQAELDWVRANESRARALAASGASSQGRSLVPVITRSAQAQGIQVNRLQPEQSGAVSVSIQGQPFNEVLRWLHLLEENNGVSIMRLAVDSEDQPGLISAQIRLQ